MMKHKMLTAALLAALAALPLQAKVVLPSVIGDHMVLQQNSQAALWGRADAGSRVTIRAEREGAQVSITVADDGPGIPDAEKDRVFEAFHTSGGALADGTRSVGLGLAVCRAVARAHGGTITVHDNRPHGAVFSLTLPAEEVPDV